MLESNSNRIESNRSNARAFVLFTLVSSRRLVPKALYCSSCSFPLLLPLLLLRRAIVAARAHLQPAILALYSSAQRVRSPSEPFIIAIELLVDCNSSALLSSSIARSSLRFLQQ